MARSRESQVNGNLSTSNFSSCVLFLFCVAAMSHVSHILAGLGDFDFEFDNIASHQCSQMQLTCLLRMVTQIDASCLHSRTLVCVLERHWDISC